MFSHSLNISCYFFFNLLLFLRIQSIIHSHESFYHLQPSKIQARRKRHHLHHRSLRHPRIKIGNMGQHIFRDFVWFCRHPPTYNPKDKDYHSPHWLNTTIVYVSKKKYSRPSHHCPSVSPNTPSGQIPPSLAQCHISPPIFNGVKQ